MERVSEGGGTIAWFSIPLEGCEYVPHYVYLTQILKSNFYVAYSHFTWRILGVEYQNSIVCLTCDFAIKIKPKPTQQTYFPCLTMTENNYIFSLSSFLCDHMKLFGFSNSCNNSAYSVSFSSFVQVFRHKLFRISGLIL